MHLRPFGNTGLSVTPLGLGLAALGRPGYINLGHAADLSHNYDIDAMEAHTHTVLDAAWDAGIRYFDAARSYGRAEAFLSSWLNGRNLPPTSVTVGSKWGYTYTADWQIQADKHEVKEHSLPVLDRQIGESRALLGRYLDLYQIHSATLDSGVLDNTAVLTRLAELKASGLRIGLSLSGPAQSDTLRKALGVTIDGVALFDGVQATYNTLSQEASPALAEASAAGLGIIVKEALANGRLTPRNDQPAFAAKRALLDRIAAHHNASVDAVALAFVLSRPWVSVALSGAARIEHLVSNVTAVGLTLTSDDLAALESLAEPADQYWTTRSNLAWN